MNNLIKQLAEQSAIYADGYDDRHTPIWFQFYNEKFAELIISEHTKVLQQEWYRLNNLSPAPDESSRDVALRVGKKIQTVLLIEQLKRHFNDQ